MKKSVKKESSSLPRYLLQSIAEAERRGHHGVARHRRSTYTCLMRFLTHLGKKDISFRKFDKKFVRAFEHWMLHEQEVCRNTSSFYMRTLRTVFNLAVREGVVAGNPFTDVYKGIDKTRKRAVGEKVIRSLMDLDIPAALHALYHEEQRRDSGKYFEQMIQNLLLARDLFLFSFCMRGLPFVDMAYLRKSDAKDGTIYYARRKTSQLLVVRIEPLAQSIIDRWQGEHGKLLPIITEYGDDAATYKNYRERLSQYNRHLRILGKMVGGIRLSSYVSRHTWATTAHFNNVPLSVISQGLGHHSEATTQIYLQELDHSVIDKANGLLLDRIFSNKA